MVCNRIRVSKLQIAGAVWPRNGRCLWQNLLCHFRLHPLLRSGVVGCQWYSHHPLCYHYRQWCYRYHYRQWCYRYHYHQWYYHYHQWCYHYRCHLSCYQYLVWWYHHHQWYYHCLVWCCYPPQWWSLADKGLWDLVHGCRMTLAPQPPHGGICPSGGFPGSPRRQPPIWKDFHSQPRLTPFFLFAK